MFNVSYNDTAVIFVNAKTNKAETMALLDVMPDADAIGAIRKEQNAAISASHAAVSLLSHILNNPRLDGYKGQTPINEAIPKELKAAIRELETEYLKPVFCKPHADKGAKPATIEKLWQEFSEGLRSGGSYAVAKGKVTAYFAHCGKLPTTDNGKLLTVAAIEKLLQNAREGAPKREDTGLAGKIVELASELDSADNSKLGDMPTAIAALKAMLARYETVATAHAEALTRVHQQTGATDTKGQAAAVIGKMQRAPAPAETALI